MKGYRCEPNKWHYSDNVSRYSWRTLEQILGIVPANSQELVLNNFSLIFSGYSPELVTKNSLELVTRNSLDRVMRNSSASLQEISRNWIREIPKNGWREIPRNFTGFSCVRFPGISAHSQERFLEISADFPQRFLGITAKLLPGKWSSFERN